MPNSSPIYELFIFSLLVQKLPKFVCVYVCMCWYISRWILGLKLGMGHAEHILHCWGISHSRI
jgi:hypothetical protein